MKKEVQTVTNQEKTGEVTSVSHKIDFKTKSFVRRTKGPFLIDLLKIYQETEIVVNLCIPGNLFEGYINKKLIQRQGDANKSTTHGRS